MSKKTEIEDAAKEFQESKGETADSSSQFAAASHQARNDAQDAGENVGDRDRSSKEDVPSKESQESTSESSSESKSEKESSEKS